MFYNRFGGRVLLKDEICWILCSFYGKELPKNELIVTFIKVLVCIIKIRHSFLFVFGICSSHLSHFLGDSFLLIVGLETRLQCMIK
jgi:hypothetical protein